VRESVHAGPLEETQESHTQLPACACSHEGQIKVTPAAGRIGQPAWPLRSVAHSGQNQSSPAAAAAAAPAAAMALSCTLSCHLLQQAQAS
jgi:hypothetical protein